MTEIANRVKGAESCETMQQCWTLHSHVTVGAATAKHDSSPPHSPVGSMEIVTDEAKVAPVVPGQRLTVFASFSRAELEQGLFSHSVVWGVCHGDTKRYVVSSSTEELPFEQLEQLFKVAGDELGDPKLLEALLEMRRKNSTILPDISLSGAEKKYSQDPLALIVGQAKFTPDGRDEYTLSLPPGVRGVGFELKFKMGALVAGSVTLPTEHEWHNVEFDKIPAPVPRTHVALEAGARLHISHQQGSGEPGVTFVLELKNGSHLTASLPKDESAAFVTLDGRQMGADGELCTIKATKSWISSRTFLSYSTEWMIRAGSAEFIVSAVISQQEALCGQSLSGSLWLGAVHVSGTQEGFGFVRQVLAPHRSMSSLLANVTKLSIGEVISVLPTEPTHSDVLLSVASADRGQLLEGVRLSTFEKTLAQPLRDVILRRGKCWRGLGFLLCIDACGGNSSRFTAVLASIEILHVGSMIVDDVQDRSLLRRGAPAVHTYLGEPLAINCGTFAYFFGIQSALNQLPWLHPLQRLRYYEEYMLVLRAGHFGQALDITGLTDFMEAAVESGDNGELLKGIMAVHRLKTGVAAGGVARIGAALGGGSLQQQEGLGVYYEAVGLAFQIMDDVLNLSGFVEGQKVCGEDISEGKVTYPVVLAVPHLSLADRKRLWQLLQSHPSEEAVIRECIQLIQGTGAFEAAKAHAQRMVESAWGKLDLLIPPSIYKAMLYAFGSFVLDRWY